MVARFRGRAIKSRNRFLACPLTVPRILVWSITCLLIRIESKLRMVAMIKGIRSLDETRRLDQSETVKFARAVTQKYKKLGAPPPGPDILVALCLISSKMNLKTDNPPPTTLDF